MKIIETKNQILSEKDKNHTFEVLNKLKELDIIVEFNDSLKEFSILEGSRNFFICLYDYSDLSSFEDKLKITVQNKINDYSKRLTVLNEISNRLK